MQVITTCKWKKLPYPIRDPLLEAVVVDARLQMRLNKQGTNADLVTLRQGIVCLCMHNAGWLLYSMIKCTAERLFNFSTPNWLRRIRKISVFPVKTFKSLHLFGTIIQRYGSWYIVGKLYSPWNGNQRRRSRIDWIGSCIWNPRATICGSRTWSHSTSSWGRTTRRAVFASSLTEYACWRIPGEVGNVKWGLVLIRVLRECAGKGTREKETKLPQRNTEAVHDLCS